MRAHVKPPKLAQAPLKSFLAMFVLGVMFFFLLLSVLIELLRRLRRRPIPEEEIELPVDEELQEQWMAYPVPAAPAVEAPPEAFWAPLEGAEISFAVPPAVTLPMPDISLTVSPDVMLVEPLTSADGKTTYRFNWQNPVLRRKIYPYRLKKLRDFLLYYSEIDLCLKYKNKSLDDPQVKARLLAAQEKIRLHRADVLRRFDLAFAEWKKADPLFAKISAQNMAPNALLFRQTYYLDRQIQRLEDKIELLKEQQERKLKRAEWWPKDSPKQLAELAVAAELKQEIAAIQVELQRVQNFRQLFTEKTQLPGENITVQDMLRFEMNQLRERWKIPEEDQDDSGQAQKMLLEEIIAWVNREPQRFPEWLVYMVIHFSGMRYMSAHSSFAEPRALLETLKREDADAEVARLANNLENLKQACLEAISRLQARPLFNDIKLNERLLNRLKGFDRNALREVFRVHALSSLDSLKDDAACLAALENYRAELAASPEPMPEWVWAEICKYTPLRLRASEPNWEANLSQRYQATKKNWLSIMNTWESANVTAWRKKHSETLDLIVTRAVCNEIAEHIQHLRGLAPVAGLTARPKWYIRQAARDPQRAYLRQAPKESDFKPGASILWLEYMERPPTEWQAANPLAGYVFPGQAAVVQPGKKEEKKTVQIDRQDDEGWQYTPVGNRLQRRKPLPTREELRRQGKKQQEINQIMAKRHETGNFVTETLRWRHEATVVGVFDMIDGRYVMTFETGEIGLRLRPLAALVHNPYIFVGYLPHKPLPSELDQRLEDMLRWERILPGSPIKERQRPKFIDDPYPGPETEEKPGLVQSLPEKEVLVIRKQARCYTFQQRDNQGLPKMQVAQPPVMLQAGMHIKVAAGYAPGFSGPGQGVLKASSRAEFPGDDLYYMILDCPAQPKARGLYIKQNETAELGKMRSGVVKALEKGGKINLQYMRERNKAFVPLMMLPKEGERIQLAPGTRLQVSATHRDSIKDSGNGVIISDGGLQFYLVLECEQTPQAAGYYIPVAQVSLLPDVLIRPD